MALPNAVTGFPFAVVMHRNRGVGNSIFFPAWKVRSFPESNSSQTGNCPCNCERVRVLFNKINIDADESSLDVGNCGEEVVFKAIFVWQQQRRPRKEQNVRCCSNLEKNESKVR